MSLTLIAVVVLALFLAGYLGYSRFLARKFCLDDARPTPAVTQSDGVDFVPAGAPFLLGQHFSAIAAAGPIVGPILAGLAFGWLPALLWIVLGAIFIGAVHDFSSLFGSVRHRAQSVAQIVQEHIGRRAYLLFLLFIWLSLVYVITAFADLTSSSFADPVSGGGVASSSILYLALAVAMGVCMTRFNMRLGPATALFLPLLAMVIWVGPGVPVVLPAVQGVRPVLLWDAVVLGYCFLASILPVWILLQPRGYLGGVFLYVSLIVGILGLAMGAAPVRYPAFTGFSSATGMPLFPILFVTVACGACSGFHGLVCSGTTSKQVAKEGDCRLIGYGGMLLEGVVALIALATVMILAPSDPTALLSPDRIYAQGLASFVERLGVAKELATSFVLLAFATFIFDTLDVATRLGRYILQEIFGFQGERGRKRATLLTLALPAFFVTVTVTDPSGKVVPAWKAFWTVFGTSNQLLAALTLLGLSVWLKKSGKPWWFAAVPCLFMMATTLWALGILLNGWWKKLAAGGPIADPTAVASLLLMALGLALLWEGWWAIRSPASAR
ncbi:MAG: carbon starvation protein A [Candidatus Omnitrophica bacterium]|nr:carbon starvation protein A [Candidatus Omnitrophota bacterium]